MKRIKIKTNSKKRLGRGFGSGKGGHTVGRGQKGQKTRAKIGILFGGVKVKKSLFKRVPFLRGKGKNKARSEKPLLLKLSSLNALKDDTVVDLDFLVKNGWFKKKDLVQKGVKIVYDGDIKKKLMVRIPVSKTAKKSIESVGGKVE